MENYFKFEEQWNEGKEIAGDYQQVGISTLRRPPREKGKSKG